jgi:HEAT repeat protein
VGGDQVVQPLLAALRDAVLRAPAAEALSQMGGLAVGATLSMCAQEDDEGLRDAAVEVLAGLRAESDLAEVVAAVGHENAAVGDIARRALARAGERAVKPLTGAIRRDTSQRQTLLDLLVTIGEPSIAGLIELLRGKDADLQRAASSTLARMGALAAAPLVTLLATGSEVAGDALVELGEPAVDALIGALKGNLHSVRAPAAKALGKIGDRRATEALAGALYDAWHQVRRAGAEALGQVGGPGVVPPLIKTLLDPAADARLREAASAALVHVSEPSVAPLIAEIGGHASDIAPVLARLGTLSVTPLIERLADPDEAPREGAAYALGEIGDTRAVEPLMVACREGSLRQRVAAGLALGRIGDERALDLLQASLTDESAAMRGMAAEALGHLGVPRAVPSLLAAFGDGNPAVRGAVAVALGHLKDAAALDPLVAALHDPSPDVRRAAVAGLGLLGNSKAVMPLVTALQTADPDLRTAVVAALKLLGTPVKFI